MSEGCTYFDLQSYPASRTEWDRWDWPGKVWTHIRDRTFGDLFGDTDAVAHALGLDAAGRSLSDSTPGEVADAGVEPAAVELVSAWVETVEEVPATCPREAGAGASRCPLHRAPEQTPASAGDPADRIATAEVTNLVGGNFEEIDLRDFLVESGTKRTLRLDFCAVERLSMDRTILEKNLSLQCAALGTVSFEHATFKGTLDFSHARVGGEVSGSHAAFHEQVYGVDAEFEGDGPVDLEEATFERYVCFDEAAFETGLNLWNGVFRADVEFRFASFGGAVNARWVDFHRFPDFHGSTFHGAANFGGATFYDDAGFSEIRFEDDVNFQSDYNSFKEYAAVFHGVADFTRSAVAGELNLRETEFKKYASFKHLELGGRLTLWNAEFDEDADFQGATLRDEADLRWATFHGYGDFNGTAFKGVADFGGVRFNNDAGFSNAVFSGDVRFWGEFSGYDEYKSKCRGVVDFGAARFEGSFDANIVFDDDVSFANAAFEGDVDIAGRFDGVADFSDVEFEGAADLSGVRFGNEVLLAGVRAAEPVDASGALLRSGVVSQPEGETTCYDFTRATVGEVDLEPTDDPALFDYFRFRETNFDGFDFPQHGEALIGNWRIHRFRATEERTSRSELINTYLKAKNGANNFGAKAASSEFFIREMRHRRKKHFEGMTSGDATSRLTSFAHWVSNWFLNLSCGYGERPLRTVSLSGLIILVFAVVYRIAGLNSGGTVLTYFLLSTQTFVTLIFGDTPEASSIVVQFIAAIQGFIGAFFIALFVFALTRSIHR